LILKAHFQIWLKKREKKIFKKGKNAATKIDLCCSNKRLICAAVASLSKAPVTVSSLALDPWEAKQ
jgi:hypothetical protein